MRNILAIFKRELLAFFVSPIAYFVITGFTLLAGYFFFNLLGVYNVIIARYSAMPYRGNMEAPNLNQWVIEGYYHTLIVILVFLIPLLTMRTLADEKRRGTFELLVTSPLKVFEIVGGKFLSVAFVLGVMLLMVAVFPLLLAVYGNPEMLPILSGLGALALCALGFASVGMAASSFTENQIVAAVSSMVALLLLYVIHSPAESIGGMTGEILNYLSPVMQAREMLRGVISIQSLVYFGSLILLGLFLSQRALDAQRYR